MDCRLSQIAIKFRERVQRAGVGASGASGVASGVAKAAEGPLGGLVALTGQEIVDILSQILNTHDRNFALIIARALDAQGFIVHASLLHRVRDIPSELYLLKDTLPQALKVLQDTPPVQQKKETEWANTIPKSLLDQLSRSEIARQNAIYELIETEREYVQDLENTIKVFVQPLSTLNIIKDKRRDQFVLNVFSNISELLAVNSKLLKRLSVRQNEGQIVEKVGDIFVAIANELYPYVRYGAKQVFAKSIVDEEKLNNPDFVKFLKQAERAPELRKLSIETFLAKPTTRLGRYLLLLKPVMEKASENNPDRVLVSQALASIRDIMSNVNLEVGKSDNKLKLTQLDKKIFPGEVNKEGLGLLEEGRRLVRDGKLQMRKNAVDSEIHVFLFDHILLLAKPKDNGYKIFRQPVPLDLLVVKLDKLNLTQAVSVARSATVGESPAKRTTPAKALSIGPNPIVPDLAKGYPITFTHLGRQGGTFVLYTSSEANRQSWFKAVQSEQDRFLKLRKKFDLAYLATTVFRSNVKVNCSIPYQGRLIVGTDAGLYVGKEMPGPLLDNERDKSFKKVLDLERINQVDYLINYDMLLLLAERTFLSFPLQLLDNEEDGKEDSDALHTSRRGKKIATSVSFFKQGICSERTLICAVKSTTLTATIKVLEPVGLGVTNLRGKLGRLFRASNEPLRTYKEFYIPTESRSIHFLKSKLCVGCAKGFEVVDLESLNAQGIAFNIGLLNPADDKLDFVLKKETVKPIAIFRIKNGDFLLCFDGYWANAEFGFFVDKYGNRSQSKWIVYWTGTPTSFSLSYPYVIAFEPAFIEVYNLETAAREQVIHTQNLRCLSDGSHLDFVIDSPNADFQYICRLELIE